MTYKTKRSLAQRGKHGAKKLKVHHPDEAPAPATKRCRYARLAGASPRRRAAALGARPRALRAPARPLRERVRTLAHGAHVPPVRMLVVPGIRQTMLGAGFL